MSLKSAPLASLYLGEFELLILLAILRLGDDAYGVTIRDELERETSREVTVGAIYKTLGRLQHKGYVARPHRRTYGAARRAAQEAVSPRATRHEGVAAVVRQSPPADPRSGPRAGGAVSNRSAQSPRLARALMTLLLPREEREFVIGDLEETFEARVASGASADRPGAGTGAPP